MSQPLIPEVDMARLGGETAAAVAMVGFSLAMPAAAQDAEDALVLDTITVVGAAATTEGSSSYLSEIPTVTASGLPLTPQETPQSISIVTQQKIIDQNQEMLVDAIELAPGITMSQSAGAVRYFYYARGSSVENRQYDGVANYDHFYASDINPQDNLAMFDRVEIVLGATGLIEGAGEPSASINLVRKRPTAERRFELEADASTWGSGGLTFDASGALNEAGTVRGRFVANGTTGNGWVDDMEHDVGLLYGAVDIDITDQTTLGVGLAYALEDIDGYSWGGLPTQPDGRFIPAYDSKTNAALPWEYSHRRQQIGFVDLTHSLDNGWTFRAAGRASLAKAPLLSSYLYWNGDLYRSGGYFPTYDVDSYSGDASVRGPVSLFGRTHDLVFGLSGNRVYHTLVQTETYEFVIPDPADLGTPDGPGPSDVPDYRSDFTREQWGLYANSRWRITDDAAFLAGGRVSWFDQETDQNGSISTYGADAEFVPYLGAVYGISEATTVYASYTGIFNPQSERDISGNFLPPVEGTNAEVGVKALLFDGGVEATAAVFQTDRDNLAVPVPGAPCPPGQFPPCAFEPGGKVRTQGIDLALTGSVTARWSLSASYTYTRSEFVEGENEGERYNPNIYPVHMAKLATAYDLAGPLAGWTLGGAVRAQSEVHLDGEAWTDGTPFRIEQPGYAVVDAMARYAFNERTSLQLNLDNLFDRQYYAGIEDTGFGNFMGKGRSATLTVRHLF